MTVRDPAETIRVPVSAQCSPKPEALQVPISMYLMALESVECPELTPPGASMTVFRAPTKALAEEARAKGIRDAKKRGQPIYKGDDGKRRRRLWSSTGQPL